MFDPITISKQDVILNPIIDQLPGIRIFKDTDSRFVACNAYLLKSSHVKKIETLQGKSDLDMPWTHFAGIYHEHDINTMHNKCYTIIEPIDINAITLYLLTNKYPWINEGKCIGTYVSANIISDKNILQRIMVTLNGPQIPSNKFLHIAKEDSTQQTLSKREHDCLWLLAHGKTTKEIALLLNISDTTTRTYLDRIKQKLNLNYKNELVHYAHSIGLHLEYVPHLANLLL